MATLLLARHGETDWNREHRFQGRADPPLNDLGRAQARALADAVRADPPALVYASPLRRAYETAAIVADELGGLPVRSAPGLQEIDLGSWSGLTRAEVEERFPDGYARWFAGTGPGWDDGESYADLGERVVAALLDIASRHDGRRLLVVTHGGPIRVAAARAAGIDYERARQVLPIVGNCELVPLHVEDGRFAAG